MRENIMNTKWQSVSYAVQINWMNDFLKSFLLVFGENKYRNRKRYSTKQIVTKQILVPKNSKNYNFGYIGYKALIKYI